MSKHNVNLSEFSTGDPYANMGIPGSWKPFHGWLNQISVNITGTLLHTAAESEINKGTYVN